MLNCPLISRVKVTDEMHLTQHLENTGCKELVSSCIFTKSAMVMVHQILDDCRYFI